ncbi:MAG: peptidoglycan editing factor PgeF [Balneolales bacterium]
MSELQPNVIIPAFWKNDDLITAAFSTMKPVNVEYGYTSDFSLANTDTRHDHFVEYNREQWLNALGLSNKPLCIGKQVHSNQVNIATDSTYQQNTDGLITTNTNLALGIFVADCAAVLIADKENKVIAAIHAGWRGAINGIIRVAITKMTTVGADVRLIKAFVSPCISQTAFEVGYEVAEMFPQDFVDYKTYSKPHIDLRKFLTQELIEAGLKKQNIESHQACTFTESDRFHSYRRDKEKSGRMMAIISMK